MSPKLVLFALVAMTAALSLLPGRQAAASPLAQVSGLRRPGDLDRTFNGDGRVVTDLGQLEAIEDLAVQRDGKIVVAGTTANETTFVGQFALARYTRDGSLDTSFGSRGKVTTEFGQSGSGAYAVALQGDGKIVVAGVTRGGPAGADIALARYRPDGSLDASFGGDGKVATDFGLTHEWANGLTIQPDGKLVVVGSTRPFGPYQENPPDFALARYNADGGLDASFDGDGKVSTAFTSGWADNGYGIALAPDGKIVAAGWAAPDGVSGPGAIDIARYNQDGSLDAGFDGDGKVISAPSIDNGAFAVVVQPDGKVVVAGFVFGGSNFALVRYTIGGSLDGTFGTGGVVTADFGAQFAGAQDLVRQPDGKLVAAGGTSPSPDPNDEAFAVARFSSSGKPDRTFHGGTTSTDFGGWDEALAVALQRDGKIVAGGFSGRLPPGGTVTAQDFALARYLGAAPQCKVPDVRGRTLRVAESALTKAHCRLGKAKRTWSAKVTRDRVISQSPKAGTRLPNLSKVNLVVSRGGRK